MMFGCNDNILHACIFGNLYPFFGIELHRVELRSILLVLDDRDVCPVHDPLTDSGNLFTLVFTGRNGIQSPVNEHAEAGFIKPGHARIDLFRCFVQIIFGGFRLRACQTDRR